MQRSLEGGSSWEGLFLKVTLLVLALAVTGVFFWDRGHPSHGRVPDQLADFIHDDGCPQVTEDERDPSTLRDYHARYSRLAALTATKFVAVYCPELGPSSLYTEFADHDDMIRAVRTSRVRVCVLETGFFDNALDPGQFSEYCDRLDGRLHEVSH